MNLIFTESILQHPLLGKNFMLKCKLVHAGRNITNSQVRELAARSADVKDGGNHRAEI